MKFDSYYYFFFSKILPIMRQSRKILQVAGDNIIRRMRIAYWVTKATEPHSICNTYCFSTATLVAGTPPDDTQYVLYLPSLVSFYCVRCNTHAQLLVFYLLLVAASTIHSTISKTTQKYNCFDFLALSENVRPPELKADNVL